MNKIDKAIRTMDMSDVISYMKDIEKHAKESLHEVEVYVFKSGAC